MENKIYRHIIDENVEDSSEKLIITNVRHKAALENVAGFRKIFLQLLEMVFLRIYGSRYYDALDSLSIITGEISSEDLLDYIFRNFCVEK